MDKNACPFEIVKSIISLNNDVSNAIGDLSKTLESSLSPLQSNLLTQLLFGVLVAITGAFSAYLFNLFHWRMIEKKRIASRITGELSSLIERLESTAVKYWIQDYREQEKEEINATEVVLKSNLRLIHHYIRDSHSIFAVDKKTAISRLLEDFHIEIFDLVTGDDFESITRKASKSKAMKISSRCSDIRAKISSLDCHI